MLAPYQKDRQENGVLPNSWMAQITAAVDKIGIFFFNFMIYFEREREHMYEWGEGQKKRENYKQTVH